MGKRAFLGLAAALLLLAACGRQPHLQTKGEPLNPQVVAARGTLAESEQATIAIFRAASPSVVLVIAGAPGDGFSGGQVAAGTGFVWDREGHIVTNYHVVAQSTRVVVRMAG